MERHTLSAASVRGPEGNWARERQRSLCASSGEGRLGGWGEWRGDKVAVWQNNKEEHFFFIKGGDMKQIEMSKALRHKGLQKF